MPVKGENAMPRHFPPRTARTTCRGEVDGDRIRWRAGPWKACLLALLCGPVAAQAVAQPTRHAAPAAFDLGAVIDVRRPDPAGLRVLAVTPGAAAERAGLRAGDRLQSINGQALAGVARPAEALGRALGTGNGDLDVELVRDGRPMRIAGTVDLRRSPAGSRCGQVIGTIEGLPVTSDVRAVDITQVEGRSVPLPAAQRHPVPAGTRVIITREHLPQPAPRPLSSYQSKAFVLEIEPDTTYYVGAKPVAGTGWVPFVWQSLKESCP